MLGLEHYSAIHRKVFGCSIGFVEVIYVQKGKKTNKAPIYNSRSVQLWDGLLKCGFSLNIMLGKVRRWGWTSGGVEKRDILHPFRRGLLSVAEKHQLCLHLPFPAVKKTLNQFMYFQCLKHSFSSYHILGVKSPLSVAAMVTKGHVHIDNY